MIFESTTHFTQSEIHKVIPLLRKTRYYFDPARDHGDDLATAMSSATAKFMVMSFTSDWRFSPQRSREIVKALIKTKKQVSYVEIEAQHGHNAFLMPIPHYMNVFHNYMQNVGRDIK